MPVFDLSQFDDSLFPPVHLANPDGLLAIGGDLSPDRLLSAYRNGIFPWFNEDDPILWWCPDPRFVLFPENLKPGKTVKSLLKKNAFEFTVNKAFAQVIGQCKNIKRAYQQQDSTWITNDVEKAYIHMHTLGYAHSAEVWQNGRLAGGLYGMKMGKVFFGESMFSAVSNASRYAFVNYITLLKEEGIELVDCQVYTEYLESLGAAMIPRQAFMDLLRQYVPADQKRVPR